MHVSVYLLQSQYKLLQYLHLTYILFYTATLPHVYHIWKTQKDEINHSSSSIYSSLRVKLFPCGISKQILPRTSIIAGRRAL